MSSLVVRNFFRELIEQILPEAPFQPTVAVLHEKKNLPLLWSTAEFGTATNNRLTVGRPYLNQEVNNVDIVCVIESGKGPDAVIEVLGKVTKYFENFEEKRIYGSDGHTGTLRLDNVGPPNTDPYEDGNWLLGSVVCVYTFTDIRGSEH